ncbi:MAG: hypothetical protein OXI57_03325 [Rhodospirillales bacterium]|nr:hypothetical protein [Rhodospirillales bacterium]
MRSSRRGRFGVGTVLPLALAAGLAVAAFTSYAAGDARADDHQLELVSIEAEGGKTQSCAGTVAADGSCLDQSGATHVASTALDEQETPKVKTKSSCSRASK